tara:strand:- start:145 stop:363 length:219 start_codon:yes stop_codon:yes gene_type:complete
VNVSTGVDADRVISLLFAVPKLAPGKSLGVRDIVTAGLAASDPENVTSGRRRLIKLYWKPSPAIGSNVEVSA